MFIKKLFSKNKKTMVTSDILELQGCLEEVNASLGFAAEVLSAAGIIQQICNMQRDLLELTLLLTDNKKIINSQKIGTLQQAIDSMLQELPIVESYILPSGGEASCRLHLARAVCRRAERLAKLLNVTPVANYLEVLSEWLFAAARFMAYKNNIEELVFTTPSFVTKRGKTYKRLL